MEATPGFEPGIRILQTLALPLGDVARNIMERETGLEPATSTLARLRSTTELFPHKFRNAKSENESLLSNNFYGRTILAVNTAQPRRTLRFTNLKVSKQKLL